MRYVILRDDDTNALTPTECLERLYRPFLDRTLPVNLAVIPDVATDTTTPDGQLEGYLFPKNGCRARTLPIARNPALVQYLQSNRSYHIVQHGCHHAYFEFDGHVRSQIESRLERGTRLLMEAGFPKPRTFVAPYDSISRESLQAIVERFDVLSTGWFEFRRIPGTWWPKYLIKKIRRSPHWRLRGTLLLSHPGCLLSRHHDYERILGNVIQTIGSRALTVLVTHWWEYFFRGQPDERLIGILHATADYLASDPEIKVIAFSDLPGKLQAIETEKMPVR